MSSLMPTCLWPPISHRYIDVVVDDGVDVVVYIDFVVVLTNAGMPHTSHRYIYVVVDVVDVVTVYFSKLS